MKQLREKIGPLIALMRLDKPIGSFLLLWPTLWALWIASGGMPNPKITVIFCLGVIIMRSAGCVINDIADRDYDGKVKRTKGRPLVLGTVKLPQAIALFLLLCLIGLVLVCQLNRFTILLSFVGLVLAIVYPFTKRLTYFPQVVLGAAFAWSVPMVFAATRNHIPNIAWLLYLIAVIWPVAYDSIYALMDKEDDLRIGVKSTAIFFGNWDVTVIFILQLLVLGGLSLIGLMLHFNYVFALSILVAIGMVCYQINLIKTRCVQNYYLAFYNNHWLGAVVFLGIILNYSMVP